MAGAYTDAPGHRIAYDRDGSVVFEQNASTGVVTEWTTARMQAVNDHNPTGGSEQGNTGGYFGVVFTEPRDIVALYMRSGDSAESAPSHSWSTDTTNGIDGTWTAFSMTRLTGEGTTADMRDMISAQSFAGCKGIRHNRGGLSTFGSRRIIRSYHVYGAAPTSTAPNRLRFWNPTIADDVGPAYFDWGDIARTSSVSRDFRIHNPSTSLTAVGVSVSMEALTDGSPSNVGQHEFSIDGGVTWATTASIGDLAPGVTSGVITLRRNTLGTAELSLWWTRMVASATSWA